MIAKAGLVSLVLGASLVVADCSKKDDGKLPKGCEVTRLELSHYEPFDVARCNVDGKIFQYVRSLGKEKWSKAPTYDIARQKYVR